MQEGADSEKGDDASYKKLGPPFMYLSESEDS